MANHLTVIEPIPLPDVQRPQKLTSLPQWVRARLDSLKKELRPDETGRYLETPVLPLEMIPSASQRAAIDAHLWSLAELFEMTPENNNEHATVTLATVSKMLMTLGGRQAGELTAAAKGEAYMVALEDVPSWAVQAAARRWYRGECGDYDYRWAPDPATLRELAKLEDYRLRSTVRGLRLLLDAKPLEHIDEEQSAKMRARLKGIGLAVDNSAKETA